MISVDICFFPPVKDLEPQCTGGISRKKKIRYFYLVDQGISTHFGLGTISLAKEPQGDHCSGGLRLAFSYLRFHSIVNCTQSIFGGIVDVQGLVER